MRALRTVVLSGGGAATVAVLALSGCSAPDHAPRPAAARSAAPVPTATPSPSATEPTASPAPQTTAPRTPAPRPSSAAPRRTPATTASHRHAPTAQDGLREDPGPRPTGQPTGPGTTPQPGTAVPGRPTVWPIATPKGIPPFPLNPPSPSTP